MKKIFNAILMVVLLSIRVIGADYEELKGSVTKNSGDIESLKRGGARSVSHMKAIANLANSNLEVGKVNNRNIVAVNKEVEMNTEEIKDAKEVAEKVSKKSEENSEKIQKTNKKMDDNTYRIGRNSDRIEKVEGRLASLESEMNRGFAMSAATSSIVYPELGEGDLGIGAGVGGYGNAQAVAIGLAVQPSDSMRVNANVSTSDGQDVMYGAGVGYKLNLFN